MRWQGCALAAQDRVGGGGNDNGELDS
jgi:hypothetical protein